MYTNHLTLTTLPLEFNIFFSKLFISCVFDIRTSSSYQLCHSLFYDVDEKMKLCEAVFELRKSATVEFDSSIGLNINADEYQLCNWDCSINLAPQSTFYKILYYCNAHWLKQRSYMYYDSTPIFLRNVHRHFKEHDKVFLIVVFFIIVNCCIQLNSFIY